MGFFIRIYENIGSILPFLHFFAIITSNTKVEINFQMSLTESFKALRAQIWIFRLILCWNWAPDDDQVELSNLVEIAQV